MLAPSKACAMSAPNAGPPVTSTLRPAGARSRTASRIGRDGGGVLAVVPGGRHRHLHHGGPAVLGGDGGAGGVAGDGRERGAERGHGSRVCLAQGRTVVAGGHEQDALDVGVRELGHDVGDARRLGGGRRGGGTRRSLDTAQSADGGKAENEAEEQGGPGPAARGETVDEWHVSTVGMGSRSPPPPGINLSADGNDWVSGRGRRCGRPRRCRAGRRRLRRRPS